MNIKEQLQNLGFSSSQNDENGTLETTVIPYNDRKEYIGDYLLGQGWTKTTSTDERSRSWVEYSDGINTIGHRDLSQHQPSTCSFYLA